jgi:3-oxoacyl-[acyl-carrier protein] reductase
MDLQLSGKTALITGASSGIGQATAALLAAEGCDVVVCYGGNHEGASETVARVQATGRQAWLLRFDIGMAADVQRAVEQLAAPVEANGLGIGGLDVVAHCAGASEVLPVDEMSPERWDRLVQVNLNGTFYLLSALRSLLREGSSVVNVASVAAHTGVPHHAHYAAAKAGVVNLTKSLARAWGPRVRVNCVAPGMTITAMGANSVQALPSDYAHTQLLTGRFAQPSEIAAAIAFLASPLCGFAAGSTLDVNGGRVLR